MLLFVVSCDHDSNEISRIANYKPQIVWENIAKNYYSQMGYKILNVGEEAFLIGGRCIEDRNSSEKTWLLKLDKQGQKVWEISVDGHSEIDLVLTNSNDILFINENRIYNVDNSGSCKLLFETPYVLEKFLFVDNSNIIVIGYYNNSNDFNNSFKKEIVKFSLEGNIIWNKKITPNFNGKNYYVTSFIRNKLGGYVLSGFLLDHDESDCFIISLTSTGDLNWQKIYGGYKSDTFKDIKQTKDGGYVAVGNTSSIDGDIKSKVTGLSNNAWIVRLDHEGDIVWERTFGGNGQDYFENVEIDNDNSYIVSYQSSSTNSYFASKEQYKYGLFKINDLQNIIWRKNFDTETGYLLRDFSLNKNGTLTLLSATGDPYYGTHWNRVITIKK